MTDLSQPTAPSAANEPHVQRFAPPETIAAHPVASADLYAIADRDRPAFWADQARTLLTWDTPFTSVLDADHAPFFRWFADGTLNACTNAVDRHVLAGRGDKPAILWEGEPGDRRTLTYADLLREVSRAANALKALGVGIGDRVAIYLPMIPEAVISMLACARIGATHSVVFGGFSADALRSRIADAEAKVVITADGGFRRGAPSLLKPAVDEALADRPDQPASPVQRVLVVRRTGSDIGWHADRDVWWHEALDAADDTCPPVPVPAEHPLFILYTSGTTGKPKGIYHSTGGYLTQVAFTHRAVFDLHDEDVYWCTADVGWITGHSYLTYGPLVNGATQVMYEGTPDTPTRARWWQIVDRYKVTIMYTAPTAIRTCMKWGEEHPNSCSLSSLRVLGSVGEPINPEAWLWYRRVIGHDKAAIVDTWWQTETGAIMISPLPGVTWTKPGSAQTPMPGIVAEVVDDRGDPVPADAAGYLVLKEPWPALARGIWGDAERYVRTYWSRFPGMYFAGDGARQDADGDFWLLGRVDDVMNVSGHRLSTAEIESALVAHPMVAEAAVVGAADETTGQAVVAFVILREHAEADGDISEILRAHVSHEIGPIAKPKSITVVSELPKTRSGKIMRRLLKDVAENREVGDVTTLADQSVMSSIQKEI